MCSIIFGNNGGLSVISESYYFAVQLSGPNSAFKALHTAAIASRNRPPIGVRGKSIGNSRYAYQWTFSQALQRRIKSDRRNYALFSRLLLF